jgi:non-haem Fe2+, alpha-ketoglutarate-dependent halogenase
MTEPAAAEIERFRAQGWLGPLPLVSRDAALALAARIRAQVLPRPGPVAGHGPAKFRHLDDAGLAELLSHPRLVELLAALLGPEPWLWQSNLIDKSPEGNADENPWHADRYYLDLIGGVNVSAWIALDDVDEGNSCLRVLPGSHRRSFRLLRRTAPEHRAGIVALAPEDRLRMVSQPMPAGSFLLLHEAVIHGSAANRSGRPRLGLAARYTDGRGRILHDAPGYRAVALRPSPASAARASERPETRDPSPAPWGRR